MLTVAFPLPHFLYVYSINMNEPLLPTYPYCFIGTIFTLTMPTITNNISIWFVALLSIQRCICVRNRDIYERVFSKIRLATAIILITVLTFLFHAVIFVDKVRFPVDCEQGNEQRRQTLTLCDPERYLLPDEDSIQNIIWAVYYSLRIVLFHVLPIIAIATSTALLMLVLYQAQNTINRLYKKPASASPRSSSQAESLQNQLARIEDDEYKNARKKTNKGNDGPVLRKQSVASLAKQVREKAVAFTNKSPKSGGGSKKEQKTKRVSTTTHMLVIISTIYLVQHIFQTILFVTGLAISFQEGGPSSFQLQTLQISATVGNLAYVAGYPAAFLLCISVQEPFRQMFFTFYQSSFIVKCYERMKKKKDGDVGKEIVGEEIAVGATQNTPVQKQDGSDGQGGEDEEEKEEDDGEENMNEEQREFILKVAEVEPNQNAADDDVEAKDESRTIMV